MSMFCDSLIQLSALVVPETTSQQSSPSQDSDASAMEASSLVPSPSNSSPSLEHFPDLCLIAILERLPLLDLLAVNRTNTRWYNLVPIVLRSKTSLHLASFYEYNYRSQIRANIRERTDLLRFINLNPLSYDIILGLAEYLFRRWRSSKERREKREIEQQKRTQGVIGETTAAKDASSPARAHWERFIHLQPGLAVDRLTVALPNISTLILFDTILKEADIIRLLHRWSPRLSTVTLVVFRIEFNWLPILSALNSCHALEHLTLFIVGGLDVHYLSLPFLARLKTFTFTYFDYYFSQRRNWLYRLWAQLDPNRLESFAFGFVSAHTHSSPFIRRNLGQLLKRKPALVDKLTRIKVPYMSRTFLSFLSTHFHRLSWLDTELRYIWELPHLAKMKCLRSLTLRSNLHPYSACPLDGLTRRELLKMAPLSSVQELTVLDFTLGESILQTLFPNATLTRLVRGDENLVDYPTPMDEINLNALDWRNIDQAAITEMFNGIED